ncbi:MAG: DEAD/DEAH box helicase family protein [Planctomycetota bacterium]|nr:DEAD/DEAH box helicase family protein [Planctomycetota bacterium]MCX8039470.1 DEAD/DEAH box helicase family protein [Planctomycetota bacterium]MDW8373588.1 DEAD/DEAH box helicase family protein [Planctomycetota bacterium]
MIVKRYTGRTVNEALAKVRAELGPQALIIDTRPWKEPGLISPRMGYEVVAAVDDAPPAAAAASKSGAAAAPELQAELQAIRRELARLASGLPSRGALLGELADELRASGCPEEVIGEVESLCVAAGERLAEEQRRAFVRRWLERALGPWQPFDWSRPQRLLVVGPTGVGKTTTIAKLAGDLVLKRHARIALVTIDTYRVGAQDQLRAYADLLDAPMAVASTPAELGRVLQQFADRDHVLIDSSGRSPNDEARLTELKGFCRACPGLTVALTVAANAGRAEFAAAVERFSVLPIEHALVTKLDECAEPGRLYGCLRRHQLPVRCFGTGQEVPDDLAPADPGLLMDRVLPGAPSLASGVLTHGR